MDQLRSKLESMKLARDEAESKTADLSASVEQLSIELKEAQAQHDLARQQLESIGAASLLEIEAHRRKLEAEVDTLDKRLNQDRADIAAEQEALRKQVSEARQTIVETRETALLQEIGIYEYRQSLHDRAAWRLDTRASEERGESSVGRGCAG
jgi:hypothetical protein